MKIGGRERCLFEDKQDGSIHTLLNICIVAEDVKLEIEKAE